MNVKQKYDLQFAEVHKLIRNAKHKVNKAVNTTLIDLYWNIGAFVQRKISKSEWGKSVVEELAEFIRKNEPNSKGFSAQNIWRMKQFYETYNQNKILSAVVRELHPEAEKSLRERYVLDFLSLPKHHSENDFRKANIKNLKDFVLEFGKDFALLGEEYHLQVGQKDYYTDLLFYHRELKCLVAFDLKINGFFDDDGNPIGPFAVPRPGLSLVCKENDNNDPKENMLCAMNRWDQRDKEEFKCGAFIKI